MAAYFGLHVGNSSVCLALSKDDDREDVVANDVGDRITPALLQWTSNAYTVGKTAQLELFRNTSNTISRHKQLLNDNISSAELEHLRSKVPYKINKVDSSYKYELLIEGKQVHITPREVAGWILKKTLSIAESAVGGSKEINVVLTVPLYFSPKSIQLIRDVTKKAGFNVLQVVDEPCAAALGYGLGSDISEPAYYCLVYRVGGYSIDATVILVHDGMFSVIQSVHNSALGGVLFTEKLSEYLTSEFRRQYKSVEINERGKYKLLAAAETVKQVLSIQNVAQCSCESIGGGYDFNCSVSRARFENVIAPLISDIVSPITEVIQKSGLDVNDVKKVVACGGTLKTPKLQETVRKILPSSEILINISPDEIIALGAAKQAGYCSRFDQWPDTLSIDTLALSKAINIKVEQDDKVDEFSVSEKTSLPIRKRFEVPCNGSNCIVALLDNSNVSLTSTSVNNLEPSKKIVLDLDINKEGKIVLTVINGSTNERFYIKYDLNEVQEPKLEV